MKQSQERKGTGGAQLPEPRSDDEPDEALQNAERRKRAERKRAQAAEMGKISFARVSRLGSGEPPRKKRRRTLGGQDSMTGSERVAAVSLATSREYTIGQDAAAAVAPEPETVAAESIKATPVQSASLPEQADRDQETTGQGGVAPEPTDEDMIPATSPVACSSTASQDVVPRPAEPKLLSLADEGAREPGGDERRSRTRSFPPTRRKTQRTYGTRARQRKAPVPSSPTDEALPAEPGGQTEQAASTPESPASTASTAHAQAEASDTPRDDGGGVEIQVQQQTRRGRLGGSNPAYHDALTRQDAATPRQMGGSAAATATPSSTLTWPSATPAPGSGGSLSLPRPGSLSMSPSTGGRMVRRRATRTGGSSASPQPVSRGTRVGRRSMKLESDSTDELHQSPPPSGLDKSATYLKSGRLFRQSISSSHGGRRLFENMAFALSSQSDKPGQQRSRLESQIAQTRGWILKDGFQELFAASSTTSSTKTVDEVDEG